MKKILIVEDSVQILAQLSYIAREINSSNKIYAFEKLEEAYRCALENDIDLFVVDIILEKEKPGDISGLQYVENIRKIDRYKFIPVIFVTLLEDAKLHTYTTKSYDELVFAQREYYGKIKEENKYVKLLYLGDSIVAGYLYEKFFDVERKNGHVEYDIRGQFSISEVPDYHLMEILGILIDNSVEAQDERPQLKFFFEERDNTLIFKILNPYPYIKYEEMNTWFDLEHSSKGAKHGLGLYYVKQICQKYRANIICRNVECQGKNWIEMNLEIEKANR
uniref:GHKL domain-containing protein n=1 Tax=Waltera intestinalis TaxID=2606635 RepID=UPI003FEE02E6